MPDLFFYPNLLLREAGLSFELMGQVVQPGQTASGVKPLTRLDGGGLWTATMNDVRLGVADRNRAWRAVAAICDGGVQPIIVPLRDDGQAPWPVGGGGAQITSYATVLHVNNVPFSTGVGYHADVIDAELDVAAALRATTVTIAMNYGSPLRGGEHFSIDDPELRWRLYRIRNVIDNGDATYTCTIRPGLRAAAVAGVRLWFDKPKCVMRLATPGGMDATFQDRWNARPSVSFIEAFPPFPT